MLREGQGQGQGQAATATRTSSPSSREEEDCDDGDNGAVTSPPVLPAATTEGRLFAAGDYCLAPRVFDRRRARAVVEEVVLRPGCSDGTCLVTWLHPRQRGELVCRYWKEVIELRAALYFRRRFLRGGGVVARCLPLPAALVSFDCLRVMKMNSSRSLTHSSIGVY